MCNRRSKGNVNYELDVLNQLTRQGDTTYSYDLCGHRTKKNSSTETTEYTYDPLGRLTHLQTSEGQYTYTYDAFNRRLTCTTPDGTCERYLYQDQAEIGTVDAAGKITQLRLLGTSLGAERGAAVLIVTEK